MLASIAVMTLSASAVSQSLAQSTQLPAFKAGMPLGVMTEGKHTPISLNVKVYGAVVSAESCSYDETRNLIVAVNRGVDQRELPNDGFVSLINHDGSVRDANGVGIDNDGNIVVVNIGDAAVLTFSTEGKLLKTEQSAQAGNDGLVILPDGTKYVSSVRFGGVARIRPGKPAELIATGIPSAASMCYDSQAKQLVIPMNPNNSLAFIKL